MTMKITAQRTMILKTGYVMVEPDEITRFSIAHSQVYGSTSNRAVYLMLPYRESVTFPTEQLMISNPWRIPLWASKVEIEIFDTEPEFYRDLGPYMRSDMERFVYPSLVQKNSDTTFQGIVLYTPMRFTGGNRSWLTVRRGRWTV